MKLSLLFLISFILFSVQVFSGVEGATTCSGKFVYSNSTTGTIGDKSVTLKVNDAYQLNTDGSFTRTESSSASGAISASCTLVYSGSWTTANQTITVKSDSCDNTACTTISCANLTEILHVGANCDNLTYFDPGTLTVIVYVHSTGLSGGAIAGIIIAILLVAVLIAGGFIYWKRRQGYQPLY